MKKKITALATTAIVLLCTAQASLAECKVECMSMLWFDGTDYTVRYECSGNSKNANYFYSLEEAALTSLQVETQRAYNDLCVAQG
jgi:hypothetical protein